MTVQITIRPSDHSFACEPDETVLQAAMRADLMIPYGCRNGACGTCKGRILEGAVDYGPHQASTLTDEEKRDGLALFCCARPTTDLVIEVREVRRAGDIRIKRLPCRIESIDKPAPDVAIVKLKLPANERLQYLAGQYIDFLLKDGHRRSFSLATPPHADALLELHIRHMPGGFFTDQLFEHYKGREILRFEGPLGSVLPARGIGQADDLRRGRHRLRADQGDHRAHAPPPHRRARWCCTGARARSAICTCPTFPGKWQTRESEFHVHPGAVRARRRTTRGPGAQASCTRRCSTISRISPAIRSMRAARRR